MSKLVYSVITGSGSYIPTKTVKNEDFLSSAFFDDKGIPLTKSNDELILKFYEITGIKERRYITDDLVTSDIAYFAALNTLESTQTDPETLDLIIVAHNFGDISHQTRRSEFVPGISSRVKHKLGIKNPETVCYDLPFGCAGWLQAVIQANAQIKAGLIKKALIVGADTLSRVSDPHDRDSMLFSDGAGAVLLEGRLSDEPVGIISCKASSHTETLAYVLRMDKSNNPSYPHDHMFLKMKGRILYEHALKVMPALLKESIVVAGIDILDISKILIHQANTKMLEAIITRLYKEYGIIGMPKEIMPLTLDWLGNSSVATLPTLYDLILKGKMEGHSLQPGKKIMLTSIGAGVNLNAVVYQVPG